jgi:antitoxin ParD1/3/4
MIKYVQSVEGNLPMSEIERMTVTLPAEMAAAVKSAVEVGDYASTSEVVRAALRDWKMKRALQIEELAALKADIDAGLEDVAAGRVKDFDATRIAERGRKLLAARSPSV